MITEAEHALETIRTTWRLFAQVDCRSQMHLEHFSFRCILSVAILCVTQFDGEGIFG